MKRLRLILAVLLLCCPVVARADAGAPDVRTLIADAIAARQSKVVIPPGVYRVAPPSASAETHLAFADVDDLEIDGTGATLVFTDPNKNGMVFSRCSGVTLRGFTVDYDPLPFTQGTIKAVDVEGKTLDVAIDAGYLPDADFYTGPAAAAAPGQFAAYLFDPKTGDWKDDALDLYPARCEQPADGVLRVFFTNDGLRRNNAAAGDRIVISRRTSIGIRLIGCDHCTVTGVTLFAAGGLGVQEANGDGDNHYTFTVTRGPVPAGATAPRLHSINADGFHSSAVKKGPTVENCLFEWMGDDAITVHGSYALVVARPAPDRIVISPKYEMPFLAGDDLTAIDANTDKVKATAHVRNVAPADAPTDPAVDQLWDRYHVQSKGRKFFAIDLDQPLDVAVGDLITSPQRIGNGYVIRGNTCRHHRARGIQLKAGDGLVENNRIEDVNMSGILLGPEFSIWLGADYVRNVVVRNNTIRDTGRGGEARKNPAGADAAGICVRSLTVDHQLTPPENRNIVIEGNRIERPAGLGMFFGAVTGLTVRNNTIVAPWSMGPSPAGKRLGVDPSAAVFIAGCDGVTIANNTIDLAGGTATQALKLVNDSAVTGADDGFAIKPSPAASAESK